MSFARLLICVGGVYAMFLAWAVAQERLSVPFVNIKDGSSAKFKSAIIISTAQSILSSLSAYVYIIPRRKSGEPLAQTLGLAPPPFIIENGNDKPNGKHDHGKPSTRFSPNVLLARYLQCAAFITAAAPFGFAALAYVSYPTMVLAKSCKLVPVMIMNVLLYRRKFAPHKYLVVSMVTAGITVFMYMGDDKKASSHSSSSTSESPYGSLIGITYLPINLALDGAVNSTQDEIFVRHKVTGQQMMFWINVMSTGITVVLSLLPLPHIPVVHPSASGTSEMLQAIEFVRTHPDIIGPLALFAFTGALGQLFIFETLQHFGSLTLVTITLTRKMGTMLLSVFLYNHTLTPGQWLGAAIVFAGISVEAYVKRRDVHAKRVVQEKEKAMLKSL